MIDTIEMSVAVQPMSIVEANLVARLYYLCQATGMELHVEPEVTWFTSDIPYPNYVFNMVVQNRFTSLDSVYHHIDRILGEMTRRQVPLIWTTSASTQPNYLGYHLEANGLAHAVTGQGMVLDLVHLNEAQSMPAGLIIERVRTLAQLEGFVHVLAKNSNMPPEIEQAWLEKEISLGFDGYIPRQRYLGTLYGEPVATSTLFSGAGVAGLYHVATLPQARGKGVGSAISLVAMQDARWLGHRTATLISTPAGINIYHQLGFKPTETFEVYSWPGPQGA
jgi:GNAT superfamily N-acetyltransferase